jgi:hypothetical protein
MLGSRPEYIRYRRNKCKSISNNIRKSMRSQSISLSLIITLNWVRNPVPSIRIKLIVKIPLLKRWNLRRTRALI